MDPWTRSETNTKLNPAKNCWLFNKFPFCPPISEAFYWGGRASPYRGFPLLFPRPGRGPDSQGDRVTRDRKRPTPEIRLLRSQTGARPLLKFSHGKCCKTRSRRRCDTWARRALKLPLESIDLPQPQMSAVCL